jgi:hypothetical protein
VVVTIETIIRANIGEVNMAKKTIIKIVSQSVQSVNQSVSQSVSQSVVFV